MNLRMSSSEPIPSSSSHLSAAGNFSSVFRAAIFWLPLGSRSMLT